MSIETRKLGASMRFFEDGTAEIESFSGYLLTSKQHEALREFMLDQMDGVLEQFERARRVSAGEAMDRVVPFTAPLRHEIN
jgi:hypothetical protein